MSKNDVYAIVTNQIINALEKGILPWVKPWKSAGNPINAVSGLPYRGINPFLLFLAEMRNGYTDNRWVSFKQAKDLGGHVSKGEAGSIIVFWKQLNSLVKEIDRETGERTDEFVERTFPLLRYYRIWNVEQCENLSLPELDLVQCIHEPKEMIEAFIASSGAVIEKGGNRAFYSPYKDFVRVPTESHFLSSDHFYASLFHELIHWTGNKKRLDRKKGNFFGSPEYAFEELIAEFGSAFLCSLFGINGSSSHESYIGSWLQLLQNDKKAIFRAVSQAKKAVSYLQAESFIEAYGMNPEEEKEVA